MGFRLREVDGRTVLVSQRLADLGIPHGFGTRLGGFARGAVPGATMTAGPGEAPEVVHRNWRQLLEVVGLEGATLALLRQVHGVEVVAAVPEAAWPPHQAPEADGHETTEPGVALGVVTADCVPVFMAFRGQGARPWRVAALHAGWRGVVEGIVSRFLGRQPGPPVAVALGPHIRQDRFEVGPELGPRFASALAATGVEAPGVVRQGRGDRLLVDLEALLLAQLEAAGVARGDVETGAPCTYSEDRLFYSYRRDGPGRGSLGHVIGVPPAQPA